MWWQAGLAILLLLVNDVFAKRHDRRKFDESSRDASAESRVRGNHRASLTFEDLEMGYTAYMNPGEGICYLEKLQNAGQNGEGFLRNFQDSNLRARVLYASASNMTKIEARRLAGRRIIAFCKDSTINLLRESKPVPANTWNTFYNEIPEDENYTISKKNVASVDRAEREIRGENRGEEFDKASPVRAKRQSSSFRPQRFRGQTQSQYLNLASEGQKEGKAEAEATDYSSRAVVSGSNGMGQAQSMSSGGSGCEDCPGYSKYEEGERGPRKLIHPETGRDHIAGGTAVSGPDASYRGVLPRPGTGTYTVGGGNYPGGTTSGVYPGTTQRGGLIYPASGQSGQPGTYRGETGYPGQVSLDGDASYHPGIVQPTGAITYPGGIRPEGVPSSDGISYAGKTRPIGGTTYPGGAQPGASSVYPNGMHPGGVSRYHTQGIPQTGSGTAYPDGTQANGGTTYPGGVQIGGAVTSRPGGIPSSGRTKYPGVAQPGEAGTTYPAGGATYPGGVQQPGAETIYPGGIQTGAAETTYPDGTVPSGGTSKYPGVIQPGKVGITYPPGGKKPNGGTFYPGGVQPGGAGGPIYAGGVQPSGGTTYTPGGTQSSGGGPIYPGGVQPGVVTTYPGGAQNEGGAGGTFYPGGTLPRGGTAYPGVVETGGTGTPYPSGGTQPGATTTYAGGVQPQGGTTYPGGVQTGDSTRTTYPGGTRPSGGPTYPGVEQAARPQITYPADVQTGGAGTSYSADGIQTSGRTIYPGGVAQSGGSTSYPGGIPTGEGGTAYPSGGTTYPVELPPSGRAGPIYPVGVQTVGRETTYSGGGPYSGSTTYPAGVQSGGSPYSGSVPYPGGVPAGFYPGIPSTSAGVPVAGTYPGGVISGNGPTYPSAGPYPPGQYSRGRYPVGITGQPEESQYYVEPGPRTKYSDDDNADSHASSSVKESEDGTQASASSDGTFGTGTAQSQVSGTYSGGGSFSAQAGTSDGKKGAQTQVSGGKRGAMSSAQGNGGQGKSETQVQLNSETGATTTGAQSSGWNHGTNSQVQASAKGGMADAQANGEGSTSSQAQIGFQPYDGSDEKTDTTSGNPFRGGGTASAQSGTYMGQSQSQLQGSFQYGITYNGAAQAGSGSGAAASRKPFNFSTTDGEFFKPFKRLDPLGITDDKERSLSGDEEKKAIAAHGLQGSSSSRQTVIAKQNPMRIITTTRRPQQEETDDSPANVNYDDEEYDENDDEYEDPPPPPPPPSKQVQASTPHERRGKQSQSMEISNLGEGGEHYEISSRKDSTKVHEGDLLEAGTSMAGYTMPPGVRGRVTAVSGGERTVAEGNGKSQAQTVSLIPSSPRDNRINSLKPLHSRNSYDQNADDKSFLQRYHDARNTQPTVSNHMSPISATPVKQNYYTVTNSVAGKMDDTRRKYEHRYYTKSSTCGYFTFSCNIVHGSNGRTKICKPKVPTHADGTPIKC